MDECDKFLAKRDKLKAALDGACWEVEVLSYLEKDLVGQLEVIKDQSKLDKEKFAELESAVEAERQKVWHHRVALLENVVAIGDDDSSLQVGDETSSNKDRIDHVEPQGDIPDPAAPVDGASFAEGPNGIYKF
ncbi:hypothetical protein L1987_40687 [Smallanthus sonchifolius]|uniref:Uncharacterized protein n=1 Tax=Smallanthus sonchifolius TaxID=185202 RepID=A0ACB9GTG9_9ASTR|nr:hypothetical protein L1987_40687 [Smallanthus sonchifolius]